MDFGNRRPTRVKLLHARHRAARLAWVREHRDRSAEDWKREAWSDESQFILLNVDGRVRIWCQAHEAMDPACQQDNCTSHKSLLATSWLDEYSSDLTVIN
ncbi:transposable element Tc1 transposase [Trichonephila clavipes]|nr:transposable element Tc1 transposase [Trichonephila clavipes]